MMGTRLHMSDKNYKYLVRLPLQLRDRLLESAAYYRRSLNSDIVARLHRSLSGLPDAAHDEAIAPPMHQQIHDMLHPGFSAEEIELVRIYRRMPSSKRAALKVLLS